MRALITILDNITETSMPFNEFVLYRANHYKNERQILLVCCSKCDIPDVVIPRNMKIIFMGKRITKIRSTIRRIVQKCENSGIPYLFHLHQVKAAFLAEIAMVGLGTGKKVLFTVHSTFTGYSFHNKILSFFDAFFARRITCVSRVSYDLYPKLIKRIKKDRIEAVQNGVDIERIDTILSSVPQKEEKDTMDFIYVARMVPIKNHKFLIDVLQKTDKRIRFIFVGMEDENKEIRKIVETRGLEDRVVFTGLIPRNQVFEILNNADAYISSSVLEGLPISVLEAMYCSLPCFLSDIPQHIETCEGAGEAVKLLPLKTDLWVKELNDFIGSDTSKRKRLGEEVKKFVYENFSLEKMHSQYDEIYASLQ